MACIFCDIVSGKRDGHILYETDSDLVFLDKYPIDYGHTLVIPKKHYEKITDMESRDVGDLFSSVPWIATTIMHATGADAFSIGQNNGKSAKQIVPHVHIHIIPRYAKTGTNWTERRIVTDRDLFELAEKIRKEISNS